MIRRPADHGAWLAASSAPGNTHGLTGLELGSGLLLGMDPAAPPVVPAPGPADPLRALEDVLRPLLAAGRCFVSFSGGRDSSALLAVAASLSRREGLPLPVALTMRFRWAADSVEDEWQQLVVEHLGGLPWEVITVADDQDLLGPLATDILRRHGLIWPPAAYGMTPTLRAAAGGTLVFGDGGDQVFGLWRYASLGSMVAGRRRPRARDVLAAGNAVAPLPVRRAVLRRRTTPYQTWLRPPAYDLYRRLEADDLAREPRTWGGYLDWIARRRDATFMVRTWRLLARDHGTTLSVPFWDRGFLGALATAGGRAGFGSRTATTRALFGDLLPPRVTGRRSKANFTHAYWTDTSRRFATAWDGAGVDHTMVDAEALRAAWLSEYPPYGSASLLHAAWYATQGN